MSRFKMFIQNFLVYGLGGVISRIVPLLMLPVVTRLMPNTYYFGLNDISTIVVYFGQALAVMGMYDAMFRMFFEKEDLGYKKDMCSSAFGFTICTSIIIFLIMVSFRTQLALLFFSSKQLGNLIVLSAISILIGATNTIVSAPTRMNNQKVTYLIVNTLSSVISYAISIPLLLRDMYIIALPLASIISALSIEIIFFLLNRRWFSFKHINFHYIKLMLQIGLPLMPNFLIYWVFNSCDRLMVAKILGNEFAGIYAIGGKIGQISQLIYTAFAGGWQYFAFSTMRDSDQVEMTSKIFEYLGVITFGACMIMASLSNIIFDVLFVGDYTKGAIVAPYLFVAPLLLMLYQIASNQFIIIKKTWPNILILSGGAILNILINFALIPSIGIEGAAFATFIGYVMSTIICVLVLQKMKLFKVSKQFLFCIAIFMLFVIIWRFVMKSNWILSLVIAMISIICFVNIYKDDLQKLFKK